MPGGTAEVVTTRGPARVHLHAARRPRAAIVLGHGAGRGTDTADLQAIARELPPAGVSVALVDQPWVVAGRRVATAPATLDAAWVEVLAHLREGPLAGLPLVAGGRSAGARVACRTAAQVGADALLLIAFPLRPPGSARDPQRAAAARTARREEWRQAGDLPVTLVQGDRDQFGSGLQVLAAVGEPAEPGEPGKPGEQGIESQVDLYAVPGADHSLAARGAASADAVRALVVAAAANAAARAQERAARRR